RIMKDGENAMNRKAFLLGLFTVTVWGSGFAAIRAGFSGVFTARALMVYRYFIACCIFLLYALFTKSKFRLPDKKDLLPIFILGVIGISFYQFGVTFGQLTISAGTTTMIVGSAPRFT